MGRPKQPLISRDEVISAALDIVDEGGLESLSMRNLGARLGVHSMSLYHHFDGKDEILELVASRVLSDIKVPRMPLEDLPTWSLDKAQRYRRALLAHPKVFPLLAERFPWDSRRNLYAREFEAFDSEGIAAEYWLVIVELLEAFILGASLFMRDDETESISQSLASSPDGPVAEAVHAREIDTDEAFNIAYPRLLQSLLDYFRQASEADRRRDAAAIASASGERR